METQDQVISANEVSPPSLFNPTSTSLISLLLTPAFGAYAAAENYRALGNNEKYLEQRTWFFLSIAVTIAATFTSYVVVIAACLLVGWYVTSGKKHADYLRENVGNEYKKRSIVKPVLAAAAAYFVVLVFVGLVRDQIYIEPDQSFLDSSLLVREGVEDAQITVGQFANAIKSMKMDNGEFPTVKGWTKNDNVYTLHVEMKESMEIEFAHLLNQGGKASLMRPVSTSNGEVPAMDFMFLVLFSMPQKSNAPEPTSSQDSKDIAFPLMLEEQGR